ncbi:MAG: chemotaxis protein CheC, partial [Longicatena sp.]
GNMIMGNTATIFSTKGIGIDITPPTVMVGNTKLYGFEKAFVLPVTIPNIGALTVLLTIEEEVITS